MDLNKNSENLEILNFKWDKVLIPIENFKQKVESMLIWWAIWDALGIPVEMKTKEFIKEKYWKVDNFIESSKNVFFNKWWLATGKTWLVSDDTILTFAWIESFIEASKIDFDNLMDVSIKAYNNFPYWFGWWTRNAFAKYEELEKQNPNKQNYKDLWDKNSAWNWVIMKQSPYAAYFTAKNIKQNSIEDNIETLTKLTHWHGTAIVASLVHNNFLMELLKADENLNLEELLKYLIDYSETIEEKFLEEDNDKISDLLKNLQEDQKNWWLKSYDEILKKYWWWEEKIYASWYVIITMWIVYSLFLNKQNFDSLLDSINIGWDTDTFWAIIWNMIWAYKAKFYSEYYENWVADIKSLKKETNKFINMILK